PAAIKKNDQRKAVDARGADQRDAHQHCAHGHHQTRPVPVGQFARQRRKKERQAGDDREQHRHGRVAHVKIQRHRFEEDPEAIGDAEADEGPEECAGHDHPGARRVELGYGFRRHDVAPAYRESTPVPIPRTPDSRSLSLKSLTPYPRALSFRGITESCCRHRITRISIFGPCDLAKGRPRRKKENSMDCKKFWAVLSVAILALLVSVSAFAQSQTTTTTTTQNPAATSPSQSTTTTDSTTVQPSQSTTTTESTTTQPSQNTTSTTTSTPDDSQNGTNSSTTTQTDQQRTDTTTTTSSPSSSTPSTTTPPSNPPQQ